MVSSKIREQAAHDIASVLPGRTHDLARLQILIDDSEPVVSVVGKYNHGKSSLLNELLGRDAFAVSDRRETVRLSDSVHRACAGSTRRGSTPMSAPTTIARHCALRG